MPATCRAFGMLWLSRPASAKSPDGFVPSLDGGQVFRCIMSQIAVGNEREEEDRTVKRSRVWVDMIHKAP